MKKHNNKYRILNIMVYLFIIGFSFLFWFFIWYCLF